MKCRNDFKVMPEQPINQPNILPTNNPSSILIIQSIQSIIMPVSQPPIQSTSQSSSHPHCKTPSHPANQSINLTVNRASSPPALADSTGPSIPLPQVVVRDEDVRQGRVTGIHQETSRCSVLYIPHRTRSRGGEGGCEVLGD